MDKIPPPPGPLGMKTPQPYVDPTRARPDEWRMLPGIFAWPDNNVGSVWGVVIPIDPGNGSHNK